MGFDYYDPLIVKFLLKKGADLKFVCKSWFIRAIVNYILPYLKLRNQKANSKDSNYIAAESQLIKLIHLMNPELLHLLDPLLDSAISKNAVSSAFFLRKARDSGALTVFLVRESGLNLSYNLISDIAKFSRQFWKINKKLIIKFHQVTIIKII